MNAKIKVALVAGLALGGLGFAAESASAMPMQGLDGAVAHQSDVQQGVQNVRYICGYWGCRWVPGPYWGGYGYGYGYRPYWGYRRWGYWHRRYW